MTEPLLICTDLDRTLIPNGPQPESSEARPQKRNGVRLELLRSRNDYMTMPAGKGVGHGTIATIFRRRAGATRYPAR